MELSLGVCQKGQAGAEQAASPETHSCKCNAGTLGVSWAGHKCVE